MPTVSRRNFIKLSLAAAAGAVGAIALIREFPLRQSSGIESGGTTTIPVINGPSSHPDGNRVIRIRVLNDDQVWEHAMGTYTTQNVLDWINDLKPTTLNRFFSGPQNPNQLLPAGPGERHLAVKDFLQLCLDACSSPASTTMFPRLSYAYYRNGSGPFLQYATQIFDLCSSLEPPQTLLSIDNYFGGNANVAHLTDSLYEMGWTGLSWGACGTTGPKGFATFAMICVNPKTGAPNYPRMQELMRIGDYGEFEAQIDFPFEMQSFSSQSPDKMADIISSLAANQANGGYHFMYPIFQQRSAQTTSSFRWDASKIFTSGTGKYHGESLYEIMKSLMQQYNTH